MKPIRYYDLSYAEVFVFENFIINQVRDGVVLLPENNSELKQILSKHFQGRKMVYISNRTFSYNVSPLTYTETSKIENLIGMCMIVKGELAKKTAQYEAQFYKKAFYVTHTVEDAIAWARKTLNDAGVDL